MTGRDPYVYPGSNVLLNKENIRDAADLADFERRMVAQRLIEDLPVVPLTASGYCRLRYHLFQDVCDWAGQVRTVDMAKNDDDFCRTAFIGFQLARRHSMTTPKNPAPSSCNAPGRRPSRAAP